jgi:hypothetical protein
VLRLQPLLACSKSAGNASYLSDAYGFWKKQKFADISPYTSYDSHYTTAATVLLG